MVFDQLASAQLVKVSLIHSIPLVNRSVLTLDIGERSLTGALKWDALEPEQTEKPALGQNACRGDFTPQPQAVLP